MIENYENYLEYLSNILSKFFEKQKEYIKCQKGCAKCCKNAQFPFSQLEFEYLMLGFSSLEKETQDIIERNIAKVIQDRKNFKGEKFSYNCPFLINESCSLYKYRGIVCRTFGLLIPDSQDENNTKIPFCYKYGLNYSMVVDEKTNTLSTKKYEQLGYKEQPLGFNISHTRLTNEYFEEKYKIKFGEKNMLIDWFIILNS